MKNSRLYRGSPNEESSVSLYSNKPVRRFQNVIQMRFRPIDCHSVVFQRKGRHQKQKKADLKRNLQEIERKKRQANDSPRRRKRELSLVEKIKTVLALPLSFIGETRNPSLAEQNTKVLNKKIANNSFSGRTSILMGNESSQNNSRALSSHHIDSASFEKESLIKKIQEQSQEGKSIGYFRRLAAVTRAYNAKASGSSKKIGKESTELATLLIGNENQLDCISMRGERGAGQLVETELLWSLNEQSSSCESLIISHLAISEADHIFAVADCVSENEDFKSSRVKTRIHIFAYAPEQIQQPPLKKNVLQLVHHTPIVKVDFLRQGNLVIFYEDLCEVYSFSSYNNEVRKRFSQRIPTKVKCVQKNSVFYERLSILSVGEAVNSTLTIFLAGDSTLDEEKFGLYLVNLNLSVGEQIVMCDPYKVYSISNSERQIVRFENYSEKYFLLHMGLDVEVIMKEGFLIDKVTVNIHAENSMLKYMGNHRLVLITDKRIEEYHFELNQRVTPHRIQIRSVDVMILPRKITQRSNFQFLDLLMAPVSKSVVHDGIKQSKSQFLYNYSLCFQINSSENRKTKGEIDYLLCHSNLVSIRDKMKQVLDFEGNQIQSLPIEVVEEKVDIAKKIGISRRDIYLELWERSKKSSVEDYRFLLDTMDYETISKELEKKLKKSSMAYRQIYKIESSCEYLLRKAVMDSNCTENDLKSYICCRFKLKKYQFYKDSCLYCGGQNLASIMEVKNVTDAAQGESEESIIKFNIQAFYTYSEMEIKASLLQLFSQYFAEFGHLAVSKAETGFQKSKKQLYRIEQTQGSLRDKKRNFLMIKIKLLMNEFKFELKVVYEEFIVEIIKTAAKVNPKNLVLLLEDFGEILPEKKSSNYLEKEFAKNNEKRGEKNQKCSRSQRMKESIAQISQGAVQLQGIWPPNSEKDWTDNCYLTTIQTVYNKEKVRNLTKSIWFQRNYLSQHAMFNMTKKQMVQQEKKINSHYVYYFFLEKIYLEEKIQEKVRKAIIKTFQKTYRQTLPNHLKGDNKIQLYNRLWKALTEAEKQQQDQQVLKANLNQKNLYEDLSLFEKITQSSRTHQSSQTESLSSFIDFLSLSTCHLFRRVLSIEKSKIIGFTFDKVKSIYSETFGSQVEAEEIFNSDLDSFFSSELSEVADLKCLLNRLNNQSRQFQCNNLKLFEVLCKAVMMKVRIGSKVPPSQKVNVQELIIYVQNVYIGDNPQKASRLSRSGSQSSFLTRSLDENSNIISRYTENSERLVSDSKLQNYLNVIQIVSEEQNSIDCQNDEEKKIASRKRKFSYGNRLVIEEASLMEEQSSPFCRNKTQESKQRSLFDRLNCDMSLYQMYKSYNDKDEKLTPLVIELMIQEMNITESHTFEAFVQNSFEVLAEVEDLREKLFYQKDQNYVLFTYLWKIMDCQKFLENNWISKLIETSKKHYGIDDIFKENIVLFEIKYRFSQDPIFSNSIQFLVNLLRILSEQNKIRRYFEAQIRLVKLLLSPSEGGSLSKEVYGPIRYPLTENSEIISIQHLEQLFCNFSETYLMELNLESICSVVNQMQEILFEEVLFEAKDSHHSSEISSICSQPLERSEKLEEEIFIQEAKLVDQNKAPKRFSQLEEYLKHCTQPHMLLTDVEVENLQKVMGEDGSEDAQQGQFSPTNNKFSSKKFFRMKSIKQFPAMAESLNGSQRQNESRKTVESLHMPAVLRKLLTNIEQIYEVVAKRLISVEYVRESIPILQKLFQYSEKRQESVLGTKTVQQSCNYIVYPLLIFSMVGKQLVQEDKFLLIKICSNLFKEPKELMKILKYLLIDRHKAERKESRTNIFQKQTQIPRLMSRKSNQSLSTVKGFSMNELHDYFVAEEARTRVTRIQKADKDQEASFDEFLLPRNKHSVKQESTISEQVESLSKTVSGQKQKDGSEKIQRLKKLEILIPAVEVQNSEDFLSQQTEESPFRKFEKRNYSYDNPILSPLYLNAVRSETTKKNFIEMIWKMFQDLNKCKDIVKDFQYQLFNMVIMHNPYTLVKYLDSKICEPSVKEHTKKYIKLKPLLAYFNKLIKQPIFSSVQILEFGKRMLYMLYLKNFEKTSIEYQIKQYTSIPLSVLLPFDEIMEDLGTFYQNIDSKHNLELQNYLKFKSSIDAFAKKAKAILKKQKLRFNQINQADEYNLKIKNIEAQLSKEHCQLGSKGARSPKNSILYDGFDFTIKESPEKGQEKSNTDVPITLNKKSIDKSRTSNFLELTYQNFEDSLLIPSEEDIGGQHEDTKNQKGSNSPILSRRFSEYREGDVNLDLSADSSQLPSPRNNLSTSNIPQESPRVVFNPLKERDLVFKRGEKKLDALLSNNISEEHDLKSKGSSSPKTAAEIHKEALLSFNRSQSTVKELNIEESQASLPYFRRKRTLQNNSNGTVKNDQIALEKNKRQADINKTHLTRSVAIQGQRAEQNLQDSTGPDREVQRKLNQKGFETFRIFGNPNNVIKEEAQDDAQSIIIQDSPITRKDHSREEVKEKPKAPSSVEQSSETVKEQMVQKSETKKKEVNNSTDRKTLPIKSTEGKYKSDKNEKKGSNVDQNQEKPVVREQKKSTQPNSQKAKSQQKKENTQCGQADKKQSMTSVKIPNQRLSGQVKKQIEPKKAYSLPTGCQNMDSDSIKLSKQKEDVFKQLKRDILEKLNKYFVKFDIKCSEDYVREAVLLEVELKCFVRDCKPEPKDNEDQIENYKYELFDCVICPRIIREFANEENLQKIINIINLSFKKKVYEQQIYFNHLILKDLTELQEMIWRKQNKLNSRRVIDQSQKFDAVRGSTSGIKLGVNPPDQNSSLYYDESYIEMKGQRIKALLDKLPFNLLKQRKKEILLEVLSQDASRNYFVKLLYEVLLKKKGPKIAEEMKERMLQWIS